ncbi:DMT family transporter [Falsihalocynthiibacter sp. S25ZX9]|uniref:DMT family transporter n=1 Tax=Falsihalocynthiibacter sp. S25ZX9 TaxID=3240870 RepID=UPI00351031CD
MFAQAGLKNWGRILLLGALWGASFMFIEFAIVGFTALWVAAIRITIAASVLCAVTYVAGTGLPATRGPNTRQIWLSALGLGVFANAVPFALLSWGQGYVTSGFAGVSMAAVPLIVLPLAHIFVPSDRLTVRKAIGFLIGFAGVALLVGKDAFVSSGTQIESVGRLACFLAAASYACSSIITRRAPPVSHKSFSAAALLMASAVSVGLALWFDGVPTEFPIGPVLATLYLGLFPTALATLLLVSVIREAGPSFLGLSNYQVPIWSVVFGVTLLGETMPPQLLPALGLILFGVAVSQKWRA